MGCKRCEKKTTCCVGPRGPTGPVGPTGAAGPTGATGATGTPGAGTLGCIANAMNFGAQIVPSNGDVTFGVPGPTSATIARPSASEFEVTATGLYSFNFLVRIQSPVPGTPVNFGVSINGGVPVNSFTNVGQGVTGMGALTLTAGDTVELRNISGIPVTLDTAVSGINAEFTLECADVPLP